MLSHEPCLRRTTGLGQVGGWTLERKGWSWSGSRARVSAHRVRFTAAQVDPGGAGPACWRRPPPKRTISRQNQAAEDDRTGVNPNDLDETDLIRELEHLHRTRHDTFLHGAPDALREHGRRTAELEREYLRRHPERDVDPARTRTGSRGAHDGICPVPNPPADPAASD